MARKMTMSRKVFDDMKAGLEEAVAFAQGHDVGVRVHIPPELDVRAIRKKMRLTQNEFAARFGFNVARLRDWEQGRTCPDGALRAYLLVIARNPDAVREALAA